MPAEHYLFQKPAGVTDTQKAASVRARRFRLPGPIVRRSEPLGTLLPGTCYYITGCVLS